MADSFYDRPLGLAFDLAGFFDLRGHNKAFAVWNLLDVFLGLFSRDSASGSGFLYDVSLCVCKAGGSFFDVSDDYLAVIDI